MQEFTKKTLKSIGFNKIKFHFFKKLDDNGYAWNLKIERKFEYITVLTYGKCTDTDRPKPIDVIEYKGEKINNKDELLKQCEILKEEFMKTHKPVSNKQNSNKNTYKEKFIDNYKKLNYSYNKLIEYLNIWDSLPNHTCPKEVYELQLEGMKKYRDALIIRAKIENINL